MPLAINGKIYYRTAEVCRLVGVSRNTLFRWLKEGKFGDDEYRDWRGWRLFTLVQVEKVKKTTSQIKTINCSINRKLVGSRDDGKSSKG
jgi:predicted site-specific integrase-resolvase